MPDVLDDARYPGRFARAADRLAATEAAALPARVRQRLAENAARFAPVRQGLARDITLLETQVKKRGAQARRVGEGGPLAGGVCGGAPALG